MPALLCLRMIVFSVMYITLCIPYFTIMTCNSRFLGFTVTCLYQIFELKVKKWNFFLSVPWRLIGGVEVKLHTFLTSALVEGEWSTSHPGRFTPRKEPSYPLNRRLNGPQRRSGWFWTTENLLSVPGFTPQTIQLYWLHYPSFFHWTLMCVI
jgi:hypothetical protein